MDYNLFYCAGDPAVSQAELKKSQRDGKDSHSQAADPMFVDLENEDFSFNRDLPHWKWALCLSMCRRLVCDLSKNKGDEGEVFKRNHWGGAIGGRVSCCVLCSTG